MAEQVYGMPGVRTARSSDARRLLISDQGKILLPRGRVIRGAVSRDPLNTGDLDVLRAGLVMGMITSSGKFAPSILGLLTEASIASDTEIVVSAATATEIVRRIGTTGTFKLTGPPSAAGTVATETVTYSSVNTTTGAITVTATTAAFVSGSFVQPTDGSETPRALIPDTNGVKVTNEDDSDIDVPFVDMLVGGVVDSSQILNYPTDTSLQAWLKEKLRLYGGGWVFDDDFLV